MPMLLLVWAAAVVLTLLGWFVIIRRLDEAYLLSPRWLAPVFFLGSFWAVWFALYVLATYLPL